MRGSCRWIRGWRQIASRCSTTFPKVCGVPPACPRSPAPAANTRGLAKVRAIRFGPAPEGYEFSYCAPSKVAAKNSPPRFLHLTFSTPLPVGLKLRALDYTSVGGERAAAYTFRGAVGFYEGHVVLQWSEGGLDYEASLHAGAEPDEAVELLVGILESGVEGRR